MDEEKLNYKKEITEWFKERSLEIPQELIEFYESLKTKEDWNGGDGYYFYDYPIGGNEGPDEIWSFGWVETGLFLLCLNKGLYAISDETLYSMYNEQDSQYKAEYSSLEELFDDIKLNNNSALTAYLKKTGGYDPEDNEN